MIIIGIIITLLIIEGIILLIGYFIFDRTNIKYHTETDIILARGNTETNIHFWIFYHLKAYAIIIILFVLSLLFSGHNGFLRVLLDVFNRR